MKITEILNLKWNYQMTEQLMVLLFDPQKRLDAFERYLATNPDLSQDCFLAEFQESFAERSKLKQDYTPSSVCKIVATLSDNADSVLDVCCGTGALTIAKWMTTPNATFYLEEYSKEAVAILLFNLAVRGINVEVKNCDVLTGETFASYKLTKNGKFSDIVETALDWSELKVDCVISNPPYSLAWTPKTDARFLGYALPPKSKADYAFVLHGLHRLKQTGTAVFVLPYGVLFRGQAEGTIRQKLINDNCLDGVIGLPENLFLATDIPVALLVFKKQKQTTNINIVNAQKLFTKQKSNNLMSDEHIAQVLNAYGTIQEKLSNVVSFDEVAQNNDFNLNLPRYVNTKDPEPIPDFLTEAMELLEITKGLEQSGKQFIDMLEQIQITGTKKDIDEFEQAKSALKQAFAPTQI